MTGQQTRSTEAHPADNIPQPGAVVDVFFAFLKLGFTSFGGPIAHLGYFRAEFVGRRRWLDESTYADLIALCQFLPGPSSSQVGIALGMTRAGFLGGLAAWCGFTLPSAIGLILFAYGTAATGTIGRAPWIHGLTIVAVAVVAQAVWNMAASLCPDRQRASLAIAAAIAALLAPSSLGQIGVIAAGALIGWGVVRDLPAAVGGRLGATADKRVALVALALFALLLVGLPVLAAKTGDHGLDLVARFYRSGSLVFGGGHVVLPVLQAEVVPAGFIDNDAFLAGYGAAQAVPGPLFTFAAYLGAKMTLWPNGWLGAALCLFAIYLPSYLLLIGALPFWDALRKQARIRAAMAGVNAAVVGLLLAALYAPVWTSAILTATDFALALAAFALLVVWRVPPWIVVVAGAGVATFTGV